MRFDCRICVGTSLWSSGEQLLREPDHSQLGRYVITEQNQKKGEKNLKKKKKKKKNNSNNK